MCFVCVISVVLVALVQQRFVLATDAYMVAAFKDRPAGIGNTYSDVWITANTSVGAIAAIASDEALPTMLSLDTYDQQLSEQRIQELHNMAIRLIHSIDMNKHACDGYFDYVCGRSRPLFTVLGHLPYSDELLYLFIQLKEDKENFAAKQKLMDFFISCTLIKSLDDCHLEVFEFFKPLYAYIIIKYHLSVQIYEHKSFLQILQKFIEKVEHIQQFHRSPLLYKLLTLYEKFRIPQMYFRSRNLDEEYSSLSIYRTSYQHNIKLIEKHYKTNSTYRSGIPATIMDWCLYLYQSRQKPMSYFYATFNVHLWMAFFNNSLRYPEPKQYNDNYDCLQLPHFVNILSEARILAVVYIKSFRMAWDEYMNWFQSSIENQQIYDQENHLLRQYQLTNKKIFFTLYAQNFCEFGKDLAENIFYLPLKANTDFYTSYTCTHKLERFMDCIK